MHECHKTHSYVWHDSHDAFICRWRNWGARSWFSPMSHVTHMNESCTTCINESCRTYAGGGIEAHAHGPFKWCHLWSCCSARTRGTGESEHTRIHKLYHLNITNSCTNVIVALMPHVIMLRRANCRHRSCVHRSHVCIWMSHVYIWMSHVFSCLHMSHVCMWMSHVCAN